MLPIRLNRAQAKLKNRKVGVPQTQEESKNELTRH